MIWRQHKQSACGIGFQGNQKNRGRNKKETFQSYRLSSFSLPTPFEAKRPIKQFFFSLRKVSVYTQAFLAPTKLRTEKSQHIRITIHSVLYSTFVSITNTNPTSYQALYVSHPILKTVLQTKSYYSLLQIG